MGRRVLVILSSLCLWLSAAGADTSRRPRLLPDYVKVQYAGTIGFVSIGTGYQTRRDRLEGDLYYGYIPKSAGGVHLHTLSAKVTWLPVKKVEWKSFALRPLSMGALVSYTFGRKYYLFWPENASFSYYPFPTSLHAGVFVGGGWTSCGPAERTWVSITSWAPPIKNWLPIWAMSAPSACMIS